MFWQGFNGTVRSIPRHGRAPIRRIISTRRTVQFSNRDRERGITINRKRRITRSEAERLAQVKLALAGLPPGTGSKYPASLSGGMVKRVALARALALDPDILFLDEPTAGLDPIGAAAFDSLIRTLRDALNLTVFLVTHDLDTLYTLCDRVAVLSQKKVLVVDTLDKVAATDDGWIQAYFHGPRGRAAYQAAAINSGEVVIWKPVLIMSLLVCSLLLW